MSGRELSSGPPIRPRAVPAAVGSRDGRDYTAIDGLRMRSASKYLGGGGGGSLTARHHTRLRC